MKKLLKVIGVLAVLGVLALVAVTAMVVDALRPELVGPIEAPSSVAAQAPTAPSPAVEQASDCTLQVQVIDVDEDPVAAAAVTLRGEFTGEEDVLVTGVSGWTEPARWPCEVVHVSAADGSERTPSMGLLLKQGHEEVTLVLAGSMRIFGSIKGENGEDIERATLTNGNHVEVTTGGRYEIWVPIEETFITVTAPGYLVDYISRLTPPAEGPPEVEHDLVLIADDRVEVFCAGFPEDRCTNILMNCSTPMMPYGADCSYEFGRTLCPCPEGEAAIRGGGRSTLVGSEDTEAWLDFRDTGSISGRLVDSGQPLAWADLFVVRVPMGLEDLPRGIVVGQTAKSWTDGTFTVSGLVSGDWEIVVHGIAGDGKRVLLPVRLDDGEHKDIGDIELWAGGGIEGILIDGVTDEPISGPIFALRQADGDERTMPMVATASLPAGVFTMEGIPPGSWRVFSPKSPHHSVTVTVEDGVITDGVKVITSEATALRVNGFSLTELDGRLLIDSVESGSPAEEAGLRPGDEVIGLQLAGYDLSGEGASALTEIGRFLLGNYAGPGVTVVVEQQGERVSLPLEW